MEQNTNKIRPSWTEYFKELTYLTASRSPCKRLNVGCIIVKNNRIIFQYCSNDGKIDEKANINGSVNNIAGITNDNGNVLGMMPHPERAIDNRLGGSDGINFFENILNVIGT